MIIAIYPNMKKTQVLEITRGIYEFLSSQNIQVVAEDENAETLGLTPLSAVKGKKIDFVITLGGDGTILRLIHRHPDLEAPIIAINAGSLGFMADITIEEIYPSLRSILANEYRIYSRIAMDGRIGDKVQHAVNDIVIHRASNPSLVNLAIYVDDRYLNTFSADGVIIATPIGSTAYSLAAGGPIVSPELKAFVITPISPHTISNRPLVLLPEREIRIEYISAYHPVEVTFDGFPCFNMTTGNHLQVTQSKRTFQLVSMLTHDYYTTLRNKLNWSGRLFS